MKKIATLLFVLFFATMQAQKKAPLRLYAEFDDLSFVKNNEYFNHIADGYTLLGNKLYAGLRLKPTHDYDIRVGAYFIKYYGLDNFTSIIPSISLHIDKGDNEFYFGQIHTGNNHNLPQQLYAFERLLDKRSIENGLQYLYWGKYLQSDTWLTWEHFIFKNDPNRERLNFGHHSDLSFPLSKKLSIKVPFTVLLYHRGGQINKHDTHLSNLNNALVVANLSSGFQFTYKLNNIKLDLSYDYFAHSINSKNTEEFLFEKGHAHLTGLGLRYKNWYLKTSYWASTGFVSPKGDDMFQSRSKRTEIYYDSNNNPKTVFARYTEPDRSLIYTTLQYHTEIAKNLHLGFVADVYYQLNKGVLNVDCNSYVIQNHLDYAMGLYLRYQLNTKVAEFPSESLNE